MDGIAECLHRDRADQQRKWPIRTARPSPTRKTVRESDEPCPPCLAVEQQSGSVNLPSFPCPLPLTDPRLSSAASCRDAVVLPRWGGENRRSGGRLPGAHRRPSPGSLRPFSSRSPGENAQARRPQACTQANNPEAQGSKHWTARVIHLARKVQTVVRNDSTERSAFRTTRRPPSFE